MYTVVNGYIDKENVTWIDKGTNVVRGEKENLEWSEWNYRLRIEIEMYLREGDLIVLLRRAKLVVRDLSFELKGETTIL